MPKGDRNIASGSAANAVGEFQKIRRIIINLQMKNESYWLIKYFDGQTLDHIRNRFDKDNGLAMIETFSHLRDEAIQLQKEGISPESEKGQDLAKAFWEMVMEFTDGNRQSFWLARIWQRLKPYVTVLLF